MNKLKKFVAIYDKFEVDIMAVSFAAMLALLFVQVVLRTCGGGFAWTEELARYVFIWQCWLGVSTAEKYHLHIRLDFLDPFLPKTVRKIMDVIVLVIVMGTVGYLVIWGFRVTMFFLSTGAASTALRIPMFLIYLSMPVSCLLYGLRVIANFYQKFFDKEAA